MVIKNEAKSVQTSETNPPARVKAKTTVHITIIVVLREAPKATSKITGNVIEFNPSAVEDIAGRLVETTRQYSRDMSIHPNPNNPLNVIQDGKLGTVEMTIAGHIVAPNSVLAMADLDTLQRWMNEPATNSLVKFGRFAVRFDDISVWDQSILF